jgi:tRNA A-37 threonylcarbamoyl transferase component Bud32
MRYRECHPEKFLYSKKRKKIGINNVGKGMYGQVSKGCPDKSCATQIAVKRSTHDMTNEFAMMRLAYTVAPRHIPIPYYLFKCRPAGSTMYYQYIPSKNLYDYKVITKKMVYEILRLVHKLNRVGIQHGDLHRRNILIENKTKRIYFTDFGFAELKRHKDMRYDYHLFLNVVRSTMDNVEMKQFVERVIPAQYLGQKSMILDNYRLRKSPNGYPGLPTLSTVLANPFFDSCRAKNVTT